MRSILAIAILIFITGSFGKHHAVAKAKTETVAVLEVVNETRVSSQEASYLTELIRASARENLTIDDYLILTRQNIFDKLGNLSLTECIGECAVITGRNLGAAYVVTGEVVEFGASMRLALTLHETSNGNLLKSVQVRGSTVEDIEESLSRRCRELFEPLRFNNPGGEIIVFDAGAAIWEAPISEKIIVYLESEPQGALVEIDGIGICQTPCSTPLSEGTANLRFSLARYVPMTWSGYIEHGIPVIKVDLTPNFGWLTVTSEPTGLSVYIDGGLYGKTPLRMNEVEIGPHEVSVREANWHHVAERLVIERAEHKEIHLEPTPINGGLLLRPVDRNGNAVAGNVLVDGRVEGRTYSAITVQSGDRIVEVRGDDGSKWQDTVTVPVEDSLALDVVVQFPNGPADKNDLSDIRIVTRPTGSVVSIGGEKQGAAPISGLQLPPGEFRIKASRKMYETTRKKVYVEKTSHVFMVDLKPKTRDKAVMYSLLLPGFGQHYKEQHAKGWFFTFGVASAVGLAIANENSRRFAIDEYDLSYSNYLSSMTQAEMDHNFSAAQDAWRTAEDSKKLRNNAWLAMSVLWIWNVADAAFGWPSVEAGLSFDIVPDDEGNPRIAATVWR